jgi:DNA-binding XRE family transcriptional regulator
LTIRDQTDNFSVQHREKRFRAPEQIRNQMLSGMEDARRKRLYEAIGSRVKQYRNDEDLTQSALAKQIGVSRTSIVNIEGGNQHAPLHVLWDIAESLDRNLGSLIPSKREIQPDMYEQVEEDYADDEEVARDLKKFIESADAED